MKIWKMKIKPMFKKISILLVILFAIALWLYCENTILDTTHYVITNKKIPSEFNDFKIAQISDFHNTEYDSLRKNIVNKLNEQNPDIIVITGDFVDKRRTNFDVSIEFAKQIVDIAPTYYVSGNHEAKIEDYERFAEELRDVGVIVLDNRTVVLKRNGTAINLVGIKDTNFVSGIKEKNKVGVFIKEANCDKSLYSILLSHKPGFLKQYAGEDMDLVLSGHIHGGQIRIPLLGGVYSGSELFPRYASGVHCEKDTMMVISRGIGNSKFPFRINNHPELVVITLSKTEQ